jgi:hypothetical protein
VTLALVGLVLTSLAAATFAALYVRTRAERDHLRRTIKNERVARVDRDIRNQAVADTVVRPMSSRRRTSRR